MLLTADQRRQLEALIDLAARSRALSHEHDHPAQAPRLQELIDRHKALGAEKNEAEAVVTDLQRANDDLTAAIEKQNAQIAKKTTELNDGTGLTSRDLVQLQEEIAGHEAKVAEFEETELESMEQLETAEAELARIEAAIAEVTAEGRTTQSAIKDRKAELSDEIAAIGATASEAKSRIPAEVVARFDANVAQGGPGAAIVTGPHCQACGQEISGMVWNAWLGEDPDEVHSCEECEAVLLRRA